MDIIDYYGGGSYQRDIPIPDEDNYNPYES